MGLCDDGMDKIDEMYFSASGIRLPLLDLAGRLGPAPCSLPPYFRTVDQVSEALDPNRELSQVGAIRVGFSALPTQRKATNGSADRGPRGRAPAREEERRTADYLVLLQHGPDVAMAHPQGCTSQLPRWRGRARAKCPQSAGLRAPCLRTY